MPIQLTDLFDLGGSSHTHYHIRQQRVKALLIF